MGGEVANDMELPLSWAASGQSILKLNIRHLWLCGVWQLPGSRMFEAYGALGLALGVWNAIEGSLAIYYSWGDMEETTLVLTSTVYIGCNTIKMAFSRRNRRQYYALARRVQTLVSLQSESCFADPALAGIQKDSQRLALRLTLGILLFMFAQCFVWFPTPLVAHPGERRLPLVQHAWDNNTNYYALSYASQCVIGAWTSQLGYSVDLLFMAVMILVAAQLRILSLRIASLKTEDCEENLEDGERRMNGMPADTCDKMYENLCLCIETHQKILRFIKHLQNTMSSVVVTQFCCCVLVACVALFQATYSTDFSAVLMCASFLPVPSSHVFLYCWAAHNVTEQAEVVVFSAYSCSWVEASGRFKRALRILISRAQKPLVLTAGHIYPINREAFVSLVNASYSYYALLGQMNRR
ncbi:odorant receptor Or2-like [Schistocerca serialis cubense]|uniref:odorant receptor Or2-like n=1 Tax=Schistocerca serialis cubense TaxID=2023355 RepID=UPI00214E14C3|nr:odorant receptor Or2-like [Schistocerca serialis cubense]